MWGLQKGPELEGWAYGLQAQAVSAPTASNQVLRTSLCESIIIISQKAKLKLREVMTFGSKLKSKT